MQKGLARIAGMPGVGGCFVCDNAGEVIESSNPAPLATATMRAIGRHVAQAIIALESSGYPVNRIEFVYTTWRLLARDLSNGQLFVLTEPDMDHAMLRLTVDVVCAGWQADAGIQKKLASRPRRGLLTRENLDEASWRLLNQGT